MAKFKPCIYDQLVILPISLRDQPVPGTLGYTINELVENHPDLSVFEGRYQDDDTGATAFNPHRPDFLRERSCSKQFCSPIPGA